MRSVLQDVRFAIRSLRKSPAFTFVAVASLALGIGATTAMFSLIYAVLLNPTPYAHWQRLVNPILIDNDHTSRKEWFSLNLFQYKQFVQAEAIEDTLGFWGNNLEITGHELPESVDALYATENITQFLGIPPLLGRGIEPSDGNLKDPPHIVVLGYEFWQRHFNGDAGVLGQSLELNHQLYTIVGVMPKRFTFGLADMYLPASLLASEPNASLMPYMRLKPGVSLAAANAEFQSLMTQFAHQNPNAFPGRFQVHAEHLTDEIVSFMGRTLALLFAAVVVLLVIGCANCSILLLARGTARQHELAVRAAVGAGRYRIARQLVIEALVLAMTGSLFGIGLAYALARIAFQLQPPNVFLGESSISINIPILVFCVGVALVSGLLFGLMPALRLARPDVSQMMQSGGRRIAGRRGQHTVLNTMIAAQVALTVVLLGAAGAAAGGFLHMMRLDLGYDPAHIMAVPVTLQPNSYVTADERAAYFQALHDKIATVPGVTDVAISENATPPANGVETDFEILGTSVARNLHLRWNAVEPEYFPLLHIGLVEGRIWNASENHRGAAVVVVNQTLARQWFPHGDAIGRQIRIPELAPEYPWINGSADMNGWMQIIGIVPDVRNDGLERPVQPSVYFPWPRVMWRNVQFLVRTDGEPLASLHAVRGAVQAVNSDQAVREVRTLQQLIEREPEWGQQRAFSALFVIFSSLALLLALAGLYSVVSYSVAQRTNEFGIRFALGAQRQNVLWTVARSILITVSSGLLCGVAAYAGLQGILMQWDHNNSRDPRILAVVVLLFLGSAAAACLLPTLRAASVDPVEALRQE